jgi:hypothetical protein
LHLKKNLNSYPIFLPQFSQYAAYSLLLEPQKMQYLFASKPAGSGWGEFGDREAGALVGFHLAFLPDQTATPSEIAMAKMISANNRGFSEIISNDNSCSGGSTLGWGIVGEAESSGVG